MVSTASISASAKRVDYSKLWWVALVAGAAAAAVNAVIYFITSTLGAFPPTLITPAGQPLTVVPVIVSSVVGIVGGAIVYAIFGRVFKRPVGIFRIVALVVLVLSFTSPLSIPGASTLDIIALEIMHVVAGASAIWFLTTMAVKE
jgi:hypothetical protein